MIKPVGEEYQVAKSGRENNGCEEEYICYTMGKGENNFIFPIILRPLERMSSGEGDGNMGEENQDFKKCGWGRM